MRRRPWRPRVHSLKLRGRKCWYFGWTDRRGKRVKESSGIPITKPKSVAVRAAQLHERRLAGVGERVTFEDACQRYEAGRLASRSKGTRANWRAIAAGVKLELKIHDIEELTTGAIDQYVVKLTKKGRAAGTIATHLRCLRTFCRWCLKRKYLAELPEFEMPAGSVRKRSRDITLEELERMLAVLPKVVSGDVAPWERLLWGVWHSGLRLAEVVNLHWSTGPVQIRVLDRGQRPGIYFGAGGQKNRKEEWVPITPEFWSHIGGSVQSPAKRGYVFKLPSQRGEQLTPKTVGRVISQAGKLAHVRTGEKWASAHDIRRSFATRYATKLSELQLACLMRHASSATTRQFYVGDQAESLADTLWSGSQTASHASSQKSPSASAQSLAPQ